MSQLALWGMRGNYRGRVRRCTASHIRMLPWSGCSVGVVSAPLACLSLSLSTVPRPLSAGESQPEL